MGTSHEQDNKGNAPRPEHPDAGASREALACEPEDSATLDDAILDELAELLEEDDSLEQDGAMLGRAHTGVHRRLSSPPPVPEQALRARPSSLPSPSIGTRHALLPPPLPSVPDDVAALRAQLQRINTRCIELLCENARLRKQQATAPARTTSTSTTLPLPDAIETIETLQAQVAVLEGQLAGQAWVAAETQQALRAERDALAAEVDALRRAARNVPDLSAIKGIGRTFAKRLRAMDIDVLTIARWSDDDVQQVASTIGSQPARIRRQRWVEQAKALLER